MSELGERTLSQLLRAADSSAADGLVCAIQEVFADAGVRGVTLYVSDYEGTLLRPAPGSQLGDGRGASRDGDPAAAGRALRERRLVDDGARVWAPVIERTDPIGVLELDFDEVDDARRRLAVDAGIMVGHLLVTARKYTDVYELLRRSRDMNLAAEMHWEILPATHYFGHAACVCGSVEPAYEVGGDAFDYCINEQMLNVAILDAMGHGLEAALLSTQAVAAYRYARRRHQSLAETALTIEDALVRQFSGERFVTGILGQLDLSAGTFSWLTAGHLAPLLVRAGRVTELSEAPLVCPLGIDFLGPVRGARIDLRPGDRILLYSDGVVEARSPDGEYLELQRLVDFVESAEGEPIDGVVHDLIAEVVRHSAGPLRDDATVLGVEYLGPEPRPGGG